MVQSISYHVSVTSTIDVTKPRVYFARVINDVDGSIDVNVILSALRMLFNSDQFKISLEVYGA